MQRGVLFETAMAFFWMVKSEHLDIQKDSAVRILDIAWPQLRRQRWDERGSTRYEIAAPQRWSMQRDATTTWWLVATFDPYEDAIYARLEVRGKS